MELQTKYGRNITCVLAHSSARNRVNHVHLFTINLESIIMVREDAPDLRTLYTFVRRGCKVYL
jgi:hypothetical protein